MSTEGFNIATARVAAQSVRKPFGSMMQVLETLGGLQVLKARLEI
jgi:hypothetical protein